MPAPISEIWTLILAVLAIRLGILTHRVLPPLREWNIPPAITGGLLIATLVTAAREAFGIEILFADGIRQTLLLVFFVGVGLSAKFSALFRGGLGVAVICLAIVVVISLQNLAGVAIAMGFGLDAALGLFFGSIPFLGGHGTAAAWAQAAPAQGLEGALEVGMACATLGLIAGGLAAGPLASWLMRREPHLAGTANRGEPCERGPHDLLGAGGAGGGQGVAETVRHGGADREAVTARLQRTIGDSIGGREPRRVSIAAERVDLVVGRIKCFVRTRGPEIEIRRVGDRRGIQILREPDREPVNHRRARRHLGR